MGHLKIPSTKQLVVCLMGKRRQPKSDYTRKSPDAAAASRNEEKDEGENNAGDE